MRVFLEPRLETTRVKVMLACKEENLLAFSVGHDANCAQVVPLFFVYGLRVETLDQLLLYALLCMQFFLEILIVDTFECFVVHPINR